MMNKTVLLITVSCVSLYTGALSYADIYSYHTPPRLSGAADTKSHNLYTPHLVAAHLSSLEDFAELTLPENSAPSILSLPKNLGNYLSYPLPKDLGNYLFYPLPKDLGRGWGEFHNTPLIQLTSVCFVTDTGDCSGNEFSNADSENGHGAPGGPGDDFDLDNAERCRQEGYTQTSCPEDSDPVNFCPYDNTYFERCQANCPSDYVTCEPPYYGVGEACGDKYASCEKDTERACQELNPGYVDECGEGQQLSDNRCSYDNSYGICCDTCVGYDNTSIPEGYVQDGEACIGCDGQEHYKIKPNPCDGYMDCGSMGGEAGAQTCLSGTTTMYDNCKPCPNLGTLTSCPAPFTCTYEECSGLWYKTGCQSGYDWNENAKTCTQQCSDDYQYTCSGTGYAGGSGEACNEKYQSCTCSEGYIWDNGNCVQGYCVINDCMRGSEIGYILYSDMTRSKNLDSSKTPIGVVVCSYADGSGQAIALQSIGKYQWGGYDTLIENEEYNYWNRIENISFIKGEGISYTRSSFNTKQLINAGDKQTYPAAWAAHEYSTEGTSPGDWSLPTAGVAVSIKNNIETINSKLSLLLFGYELPGSSSNLLSLEDIGPNYHETDYTFWTSTEDSSLAAWLFHAQEDCGLSDDIALHYTEDGICDGYYNPLYEGEQIGEASKYKCNKVRPVISFCPDGYEFNHYYNICKKKGACNGSAQNCKIGDIVYSDKTCSATLISGKTPIAVVVHKSPDGNCAQAISLKDTYSKFSSWGAESKDITGVFNYNYKTGASQDYASCENTTAIVAETEDEEYNYLNAANDARKYNTAGTEMGDWCLPAAGILIDVLNNLTTINNAINLAGGSPVTGSYWSSSERTPPFFGEDFYSWGIVIEENRLSEVRRDVYSKVRPVIEF